MARPYRSKKFMAFCHQEADGICCICMKRRWEHLHHFGHDGGMSMKPSDNSVCRLCAECHRKNDVKYFTMIKNDQLDLLAIMSKDALELNKLYLECLEEKKR